MIKTMADRYRKHIVTLYAGASPMLDDELKADLYIGLDSIIKDELPVEDLHLGILKAMLNVLDMFDITDKTTIMYTAREKIRVIIRIREETQQSYLN
ncbi:MAG: hypothetical protein DRI46_11090 [Chloroflexi bacterium]|nr:MAG: hypothetical protein DRI46_11090 [Chloroflexota bacterium]